MSALTELACLYTRVELLKKPSADSTHLCTSILNPLKTQDEKQTSDLKVLLKSFICSVYRDFPSTPAKQI